MSSRGLQSVESQPCPTRKVKIKVKRPIKRQSMDDFNNIDINNKKLIVPENPQLSNVFSMTQIEKEVGTAPLQWNGIENNLKAEQNPIRIVEINTLQSPEVKGIETINAIVKDKIPAIKSNSKTNDVAKKLLSLIETELGNVMCKSRKSKIKFLIIFLLH